MKKIAVGIVFGGRSGEHEVAVRSAKTVIEKIDRDKYEVVPIAITRDGNWLNPVESLGFFPPETQSLMIDRIGEFPRNAIAVLGDTKYRGITKLEVAEGESRLWPLDVIFPILHGTFGEDGTVQGLFEMAGIPYVGCGVLSSSCGMDKVFMKILFRDAGLPICKYVWFLRSEWEHNNETTIRQIESKLGYPCFVKPANLGSSVGISKASNKIQLRDAIDLAAEYDRKIIVEECLEMREIECAVLGNDEPRASLPGEYIIKDASKKFLDYTEKYAGTGSNEFVVPAPLSEELGRKVQQLSIAAFKAIDGSGLARVDFFLRNDNGALLVNEINTMPGLTDASGYPKMWEGTGLEFSQVVDALITLAIERHADLSRNKTTI
ncbi:MAG: D-alanine--D-alanine ligase [Acidobacteria bacterium]|nr:D-alanine--D-alanine ligase [Acidobacteriota bacterium]MBK8150365.1 D-alanine--D-alanine ligase [Acidobacteriota bacterium]MBK8811362.1 D-alanine--D-alanine ligase [Acidobacteriota bacterium]